MTELNVDFATGPAEYRHWTLEIASPLATLRMTVDPSGGLFADYELKTNSYDLGVDIELYDITQRLRFEHPEVRVVVLTGGLDRIFCAGANIQMLAAASHGHKVNFCKFTNETRNAIEDASANSGQVWIAAVNGTAAGGGYELALACDEILLVDDRSSSVSLPEIPLLAVLPGTGGLTRVVEKRGVRRDLADAFSTRTEGLRGQTAAEWGLVDQIAPASAFDELIMERVKQRAAESDRPESASGIELSPLDRTIGDDSVRYAYVGAEIDRTLGTATITISGPRATEPTDPTELEQRGAAAWILATVRELDDAILHLRFNEPTIGTWVFRTEGDPDVVTAAESILLSHPHHWLARETRLFWTRTLKRLDVSSRSLITLVEPGSCFAGVLCELLLVADRSFMLDGTWEDADDPPLPATVRLTDSNLGTYPMSNDLSRLQTRFWRNDHSLAAAREVVGEDLAADLAAQRGLVTFIPDDLDWDDEIRLMLEERNSFSPDALTGMEANYRFVGPETMETKIFARLSAWQNWIFQRPNAVGDEGALKRFGTGSRPDFDKRRV
ncbi:MAG: 2,3-epoxybenzoyl-CoA dihydrolase [Acidimicrobiales bacterium]